MKLSQYLCSSLVLAALAAGVSFKAVASEADVVRESQDRAEIEALMWRYGVAPRVAAAGKGVDTLVRYKGHWLIQTRDVAVKG
jgi:hypothetical protein